MTTNLMSSSDATTAGGRVVVGVGGAVIGVGGVVVGVEGGFGFDCDSATHDVARTSGA